MGLSRAEKNRRKRDRRKRVKQEQRQLEENDQREETDDQAIDNVEIEYVVEDFNPDLKILSDENGDKQSSISEVLRRFHERSTVLVSDDEILRQDENVDVVGSENFYDEEEEGKAGLSKKRQRKLNRPTVSELKNKVDRADLVEAHDVTSADPEFLLFMKALPGTVPVPRHWGRKRKYLQGKRGIEKAPFKLPDFIARTGISEVRSALDEDENKQSIKKKNRSRVAPKMGGLDVDYRTLHDAFFKHQNKASIQDKLTKLGDLYYEGKEFETQKSNDLKVGGALSSRLRDALGMTTENSPPPWLVNMQRFGPPPSYPNLAIPGLNAPLPEGCTYGYHLNGWGKPPIDAFGRPLYGGNPFDAPGSNASTSAANWDIDPATGALISSNGKTVSKNFWGGLPIAAIDLEDEEDESSDDSSDEESSTSAEEMAESDEENDDKALSTEGGVELNSNIVSTIGLRKQPGDETPAPPQQLYKVLQETEADKGKQAGAVFTSDIAYIVPGSNTTPKVPEGAESVLSKAPLDIKNTKKRSRNDDGTNDDDDLGKKFKF